MTSAKTGNEIRVFVGSVHPVPETPDMTRVSACSCVAFNFYGLLPHVKEVEIDVEARLREYWTVQAR